MGKHKVLALIPARAGSSRVPGKNIRYLAGHPLIAYTITSAHTSGLFDRIIVSTDSELTRNIAIHYGAEAPFLRPKELASSISPDIEWIKHAFSQIGERYDSFFILRPTSPFRQAHTILHAWQQFKDMPDIDSLRAVELCHEHPGKMWVIEGKLMRPLLDQSNMKIAWHGRQYQDLPEIYVQNSALEIARTEVIRKYNSKEGKIIAPFFTNDVEGFTIDYERDWKLTEYMIRTGEAALPEVDKETFASRV